MTTKKQQHQQRIIVAVVAILCVALVGAVLYLSPQTEGVDGLQTSSSQEGSASTPYGETLDINLNTGAQTSSGASWLASYTDSDSQNVYTVNGTYKSQEQVSLGYSLSVTHGNVESIQITDLHIRAVDTVDSSDHTYTLASSKALSGTSPISDTGSTTRTITQHLQDITASSSSATVRYYIYCKVQAVGTVSGLTLEAEIAETQFAALSFAQNTESASTAVTPTVGVASWSDGDELIGTCIAIVGVSLLVLAVYFGMMQKKPGKRRR